MIGKKAEVVAKGLAFPEGPVILEDGRLAVCEEIGSRISVFDGKELVVLARTGGAPNGATLGSDGHLYVTQNGGVVGSWRAQKMTPSGIQKASLDGEVEFCITEVNGELLKAPNDLCFGRDGRLYFTDPAEGYAPHNRVLDSMIFAVGGREQSVVAQRGPVYTNGLGFLSDGTLLWVESYERDVYMLKNGRSIRLCQLPENHIPDGFAVSTDDRVFIASTASHAVTIISAAGDLEGVIELDSEALPTNCVFEGNTLWVTDAGCDFQRNHHAGRLWRVETDAVGLHLHKGSL